MCLQITSGDYGFEKRPLAGSEHRLVPKLMKGRTKLADNQTTIDVRVLETASPQEEQQFFDNLEKELSEGSDEVAKSHLAAGRAIYIGDDEFPGKVIRLYPDGRREIIGLDENYSLVVERVI